MQQGYHRSQQEPQLVHRLVQERDKHMKEQEMHMQVWVKHKKVLERGCKQVLERLCKQEQGKVCKQEQELVCKQVLERVCKQERGKVYKQEQGKVCKQERVCKQVHKQEQAHCKKQQVQLGFHRFQMVVPLVQVHCTPQLGQMEHHRSRQAQIWHHRMKGHSSHPCIQGLQVHMRKKHRGHMLK